MPRYRSLPMWILCCHLGRHHPKFWLLFGHYITESQDEDKWTTTTTTTWMNLTNIILNEINQTWKEYSRAIYWKKTCLFLRFCHIASICMSLSGGFLVCSSVTVYLAAMPYCSNYCLSSILLPRRTTPSLFLFFRTSLSSFTKKQTIPVGNLIRNTIICRSVWRTILVLKFQSMDMVKSSLA